MTVRTITTTATAATLLPGTDAYEAARQRHTPQHYPAAIVEARTADDVRRAVLTARRLDVPVAVRATGHGSLVAADGALLISTAAMQKLVIDPATRTALLEPGLRWADVIAAAEPYGLSPTSGDFPGVGVAGFTTGGGVGWLARRYGYAADNLLSARLITADGRDLRVDASRHPDLFWAIRGGSGNFGVLVQLELRLAPVSRVIAGVVHWPIERAAAALRWFADHADDVPDEVTLAPVVRRTGGLPGSEQPMLSVRLVGLGAERLQAAEQVEQAISQLRRVAGEPVAADLQLVPYAGIRIPGTPPRGFELYDRLTDDVITTAVRAVTEPDGGAEALEFHHWGGATARPPADHGPVGHRQLPFSIKINAEPAVITELAAASTGRRFLNFLADPSQVAAAYRVRDYYRLREVKRRWDPQNVFRVNHNIPPA